MIEGRCSIRVPYQDTPLHEWSQVFCAVPRVGEFVQGAERHMKGCVVAVTHCEDDSGVFIGVLLD